MSGHFIYLDSEAATILDERKHYENLTLCMPICLQPPTEFPCRRTKPGLQQTTYGRVMPW